MAERYTKLSEIRNIHADLYLFSAMLMRKMERKVVGRGAFERAFAIQGAQHRLITTANPRPFQTAFPKSETTGIVVSGKVDTRCDCCSTGHPFPDGSEFTKQGPRVQRADHVSSTSVCVQICKARCWTYEYHRINRFKSVAPLQAACQTIKFSRRV